MPYTQGDAVLPADDIDYGIEVDEPLPSPQPHPASDLFRSIGERVAALVPDAATLQLGIGGVPDAVLDALAGRHDLTVWSEMVSDGVLALDRAGALDPGSPVTASFVFGSPELYDWINRNPRIRLLRTEKTNDPGLIARHPRMVSVKGALQVDLFAQANAARDDLLRIRWANRLRGWLAAFHWRPRDHRPAVLAPQGRCLHRGAPPGRAGDVVPAQLLRQRAGHRRDLGT